MSLLYNLEAISDYDHEKVHHNRHRKEDPGEHEECSENHVKLHHFLEGVGYFISQHDAEKTEVSDAGVSKPVGGPENCKAEHAEADHERKHIDGMSDHIRPSVMNSSAEEGNVRRVLYIFGDTDPT